MLSRPCHELSLYLGMHMHQGRGYLARKVVNDCNGAIAEISLSLVERDVAGTRFRPRGKALRLGVACCS